MELYKYTGSVAALTVRFGKAETITLYDSYDDSVAPVRLDVRGALAEYIKKIEGTDSEERYMNLDWYYDFNMQLRRVVGVRQHQDLLRVRVDGSEFDVGEPRPVDAGHL